MPGPISITNSQQAIDMLSQLQSGKSYMVSSDGKSLKEATLGHKIRQAFGFESAQKENKAVLDLIKDTLKADPKYANLANTMFNGVDTKNAITTAKIKAAFNGLQSELRVQTRDTIKNHVTTQLANLIAGKDENVNTILDKMTENSSAQMQLRNYLWAGLTKHVYDSSISNQTLTMKDINNKMTELLKDLADEVQKPTYKDSKDPLYVLHKSNTIVQSMKDSVKLMSEGAKQTQFSALNKTQNTIGSMEINEKNDAAYSSMKIAITGFKDNFTNLISNTKKAKVEGAINKLEARLEALATSKNSKDEREFKDRVANDPEIRSNVTFIYNYVHTSIKELMDLIKGPIAMGINDSDTLDLVDKLNEETTKTHAFNKDVFKSIREDLALLSSTLGSLITGNDEQPEFTINHKVDYQKNANIDNNINNDANIKQKKDPFVSEETIVVTSKVEEYHALAGALQELLKASGAID